MHSGAAHVGLDSGRLSLSDSEQRSAEGAIVGCDVAKTRCSHAAVRYSGAPGAILAVG